jgi:GMP synthase-like glutamine amidotransferase
MTVARRRFLRGLAGALATPLVAGDAFAAPFDRERSSTARERILFVVIDRPEDAQIEDHRPNIRGLESIVGDVDRRLHVAPITIGDVAHLDARALDATFEPLAIVGAGSFTEWFRYATDAAWQRNLDHWMEIVRETTIPMLAICGSHQLVALAFNGFGAVAHMNDGGAPVPISAELAASPPRPMWPARRVGEEGTYPLTATPSAEGDPLVRAMGRAPAAASHHKDMVVDVTGFSLLYRSDDGRSPATRAGDQARNRCIVQALRRDDPRRVLYTTQFHPEMSSFDESTGSDDGAGAAFIGAFLEVARRWWRREGVLD